MVAELATKLLRKPQLRPTTRKLSLEMQTECERNDTSQYGSPPQLFHRGHTRHHVPTISGPQTMTERKTPLAVSFREIPSSPQMKSQLLSTLWGKDVSEDAIRTGAVDADAYLE